MSNWTSQQAYFKAYYELFDTIYTSWGFYGRLQGFFKDNADLMHAHFDKEGTAKRDVKRMLQKHLTQIFIVNGGYESIGKILD